MSCSSASITALAFSAGTSMLSSASYNVNSKLMPAPPRLDGRMPGRPALGHKQFGRVGQHSRRTLASFNYQTSPHNSAETPHFSNTDGLWSIHCSVRPQCRKYLFHENRSIAAVRLDALIDTNAGQRRGAYWLENLLTRQRQENSQSGPVGKLPVPTTKTLCARPGRKSLLLSDERRFTCPLEQARITNLRGVLGEIRRRAAPFDRIDALE